MKIIKDLKEKKVISSQIAIIFLVFLGLIIAWFTVISGEKIANDAENSVKSTMFNRIGDELDTADTLK